MLNMKLKDNEFSLADFISDNKEKIDLQAPKNPSIKKDDSWRNEDFWDDLYGEIIKK